MPTLGLSVTLSIKDLKWLLHSLLPRTLDFTVSTLLVFKNLNLLLDERVGNLTFVVSDPKTVVPVKSQISLIIRANWSNPPAHGARVVAMVLTNPQYRKQWFDAIQVNILVLKRYAL